MSDDRTFICNVISEMLDHPNEYGIYETTKAYDKLEERMRAIRRQPTPEAANKVANLPAYWRGVADMKGAKDSERFDRALRCCAADLEDALKSAHPPKPEPTEAPPAYMFSVRRVSPAGQPSLDTFAAIDYHCQDGEELKSKEPLFYGVAPKPPAEWMAQHKIIIESLAEIVRLCQCHPGGLKWREEMISREPVIAFVLRIRGAADAISDYLRHTPKVPEGNK